MARAEWHWHWVTASGQEGGGGDPTALFPYWSFTKTLLAVCALKLAEKECIRLDDLRSGEDYTLRQLLNHTAGLADYAGLAAYHRAVAMQEPPWPRAKIRAAVGDRLFAPGTGWSYSNVGYLLVREALEQAGPGDLSELVARLIAGPLGLRSLKIARQSLDFAQLHWTEAADYDPGWVYHGCATGNARDAAHLLHEVMSGRVISPRSLREMMRAIPLGGAIPGRPWTQCAYGLGLMSGIWGATDRGQGCKGAGRVIGHSGSGPFSVSAVYHFPDLADLPTVAVFSNGADEGRAERRAMRVALSIGDPTSGLKRQNPRTPSGGS